MTEAELAELVAEQVEREVERRLGQFLDEIKQQLSYLREDARRRHQEHAAVMLQLAQIERQLGIDPVAREIDPNYRN
jgi:hypothetical protein